MNERLPITLLLVSAVLLIYGCLRPRSTCSRRAAALAPGAEFVMFHSPSCGHCVRAMPAFDALKPPSHVRKVKVDCNARADVARDHGVNAYPTYRLYPSGMQNAQDFTPYHGPRDEAGMRQFLDRRHVRFA